MRGIKRHRLRVGIAALVVGIVVALLAIAQISSIDWDMGQRRRQKTAFLRIRQITVALDSFKRQNGGYPSQIQTLHDGFVESVTAKDEYHSRDSAESSWQQVIDVNRSYGYIYDYKPSRGLASGSELFLHYELHADPAKRGKTGFKFFYATDDGVIRWNDDRRATANDPPPDIDPVLDLHSYWAESFRGWKKE